VLIVKAVLPAFSAVIITDFVTELNPDVLLYESSVASTIEITVGSSIVHSTGKSFMSPVKLIVETKVSDCPTRKANELLSKEIRDTPSVSQEDRMIVLNIIRYK
jgi:hypothetical protein